MAELLLLCRHMRRDDETALSEAASRTRAKRQQAASELKGLVAVAEMLSETLRHDNIQVIAVRHADSPIATTHARWLGRKLRLKATSDFSIEPHVDLDPAHFVDWAGTAPADCLLNELVEPLRVAQETSSGGNRAVMVVGHMPQLGWLGSRLIGNRPIWTRFVEGYAPPLALKNGEVAAIELTGTHHGRPQGHLEWTVAPDEKDAIDDLRDKIKSKMDIAKLLGGFMTLVLGGVVLAPGSLDELSRGGDRWAVYAAAVAFLIAIGLYLRTMYAYDTLLMPTRYWGEDAPGGHPPRWLVRRPPSSAAWVLYQNMLHIWTFLFTPATVAVAVGLLALAYAALDPGWVEGGIGSLVLLAFTLYALWRRPVLGSQD